MEPITFSLLMLGATFGSTMLQGLFQDAENKKNRKEAKSWAATLRQDKLKEQKRSNKLATGALNLNKQKLDFDEEMFQDNTRDINTEKSYLLNKNKQTFLGNAAQKITGSKDEDFLLKGSILNRY